MKTNDTLAQLSADEIKKQDQQLDEAALDGVVGGARPRDETSSKTTDVTRCCW